MRVSWLIPFTAGMFFIPALYGVIGDYARNQIEDLALRLRTQFQASLTSPVGKVSNPHPGTLGPHGEQGTSNKVQAPVEGRTLGIARPKADPDDDPGVAPIPNLAPGKPEKNLGNSGAVAQHPEKGASANDRAFSNVQRPPRDKPPKHFPPVPPRESGVPAIEGEGLGNELPRTAHPGGESKLRNERPVAEQGDRRTTVPVPSPDQRPPVEKPRAELGDEGASPPPPPTGSLGITVRRASAAQSHFIKHRTRSIRFRKTAPRIRHRELGSGGSYQHSKRYNGHGYRHYDYNYPTVGQHGSDWTGRAGCTVVYIPYGYTWILAQDPHC